MLLHSAIVIFGTMAKTALIIGATGLVGEQCLNALLGSNAYEKVIAVTRKSINSNNPKLQNIISNFENTGQLAAQLKADHVFCAMGTTIARAGSQAAFKVADYQIPLQVATLALQNGAQKFILVSSLGADARSAVFYSRVKGELEEALKKLNYGTLIILRPSILLGNRREKRTGEAIGRFVAEKFSFLFAGPLKKYKGTPAGVLGNLMVKLALEKNSGVLIIENDEILK